MNVETRNDLLLQGKTEEPGLFPALEASQMQPVFFDVDFGLKDLPVEPGLLVIRGPRQWGKSTWLEHELKKSVIQFGGGSAFYVNGDYLSSEKELYSTLLDIHSLYSDGASVRRLFVDEITSVPRWELAIKKLFDEGVSKRTLIVTTGSQAVDLRKGSERLPGRKGRLDRNNYRFLPVSYTEFDRKCRKHFADKTLFAYLMSGGSPLAANELVQKGRLPPYVIELTKEWIFGECSRQGRDPSLLMFLLHQLHDKAMTPVSLTKLARDSGAANNTVIQGYMELIKDLMTVTSCYQANANTLRPTPRKAAKFHFINLLAAISFDPTAPWTLQEFTDQSPEKMSKWYEWAVAAHIWKKAALRGELDPESQLFWLGDLHEIDFISKEEWVEVKAGPVSPNEFLWFPKIFPKKKLRVVATNRLNTAFMTSETIESFLSDQKN